MIKKSQIPLEQQRQKFSILVKMIKSIQGYSYKVNEWIGKGYSSTVHKGKKDSTGEEVSLKVIQMSKLQDPINEMLLQHEISALKSLSSSSHVLHLFDVYGTRNNTYIITELMQGDLHTLLKQKKQFPYYEAVQVIKQIINGYYDVYKNGYLHRDIKPANIFYKKDTYKIADFGFAIPVSDAHNHRHYNVGSPVYMPPQALKENIYSPTCDTWAIGIIFYQLLKGLAPWRAVSQQKLYDKIINEPLNQLTMGLPQIARVFLSRVLNLDKEKRITPEELITWPQQLFSVQIRGAPQTKMNVQKVPLQEVALNNINFQNQPSFYSRSKSYSSNQVPSYVSGLRINLNNCQVNTYKTQSNQLKNQTSTLVIPQSTNRPLVNAVNFESAKQPLNNWQKTSTFFTPSDVIQNQLQPQTRKIQSMTAQFYAQNMISYIKFIHRVIKFISNPTQIPLRDLQMSLVKFLFKQIETIKRFMDSQNTGISDQIPRWKQYLNSSEFNAKVKEPLNLLTKKYKMFLILPKEEFILEIYRQQILDGIQKVFSHLQKGNHSDKALVSLDYLVSFYQVWDYREKKGKNFNLKEFLEFSRFDNIMSCNPYDVKTEHFAQLRSKMNSLGLIETQKIASQISLGFRSNQVKPKQLPYNNNKQNYLRVPMRY